MKKTFRLLSLMLCTFAAVSAWAAVPFTPTTIENGEFAASTRWYTMQLGGNYITDNAGATKITLAGHSATELAASDLWCFVADGTNGYKIYNKQAGTGKVLAASKTMSPLAGYSGTGGGNYPTMQDAENLPAGYSGSWNFEDTDIIENGQFMILNGTDAAVNNFGGNGVLAFWAEGKDANSAIAINLAEATFEIKESTGSFTSSNASKTWHSVWSSSELSGLTYSCGANNMVYSNGYIATYTGSQTTDCAISITAPEGYNVAAYSFDFANTNGDTSYSLTIEAEDQTFTTSASKQSLKVEGLDERAATYHQKGSNSGVTYSNFFVTIRKSSAPITPSFTVFQTVGTTIPYRIPAIAQAKNGNLIAVADYRYSKGDIGSGRLDLHYRISQDNGETWGDVQTLISCNHNGGGNLHTGYGDPCIVADRESNRVMVLSCSGNVMFPNGTLQHHQGIARFYSEDNGETWSKPYDLSDSIYNLFQASKVGKAKSMFVGSGKISQSQLIKVGDYYRIYCAVLLKDENNVNKNYALYSDDFGETWSVLGGVDAPAIPSGADEPKADELPDGSVLVSSRVNGGRFFNVYRYTDSKAGAGSWGTSAFSSSANDGTASPGYTCNGEILTIPVTRTSDNKAMYLQLQSVPFGTGRVNVGIYYKGYETLNDFATGDNVAKDWEDRYPISTTSSCYSTMVLLENNTVAFLFEENSANNGYDIVYKNFTVEAITDGAYTANLDVDRHAFIAASVDGKVQELDFDQHNYVGAVIISDEAKSSVTDAIAAYKNEPSMEKYEAINKAINEVLAEAEGLDVQPGAWYRIRNHGREGNLYLKPEASRFSVAASKTTNADQYFTFEPTDGEEGTYYLFNGNYELYLGPLGANETQPTVMDEPENAGIWTVTTRPNGRSSIVCQNKTGTHVGLHLAGDKARLVPWTADEDASLWYIEPVNFYDITVPESGYTTVCLPFPVALPEGATAYLPVAEVKVEGIEGTCLQVEAYEEGILISPAIIKGAPGKLSLPILNIYDLLMPSNLDEGDEGDEDEYYLELDGTLKAANVSGNVFLLNGDKFKKRSTQNGTVAANTAYYVSDIDATELSLTEQEGEPVGIESVKTDTKAVKLFTLDGRPVSKPGTGIYVTSDGRKIFVK